MAEPEVAPATVRKLTPEVVAAAKLLGVDVVRVWRRCRGGMSTHCGGTEHGPRASRERLSL